jgi:transcriptional regulator with XRE-family HTH domain
MRKRPTLTVGQFIRDARIEQSLTQNELADKLKKRDGSPLQQGYLSEIENDRRNPPDFLVPQLADVLGIEADRIYLLSGMLPPNLALSKEELDQVVSLFQDFSKPKRASN